MEEVVKPVSTNQESQVSSETASKISPESKKSFPVNLMLIAIGVIVIGVLFGWLLNSGKLGNKLGGSGSQVVPGAKTGANEAGLADEKAFPDTAQGVLGDGGINGEGTHNLVRDGGPSQTVYLTSTVIDLSSFIGKKVQVWGQTNKGRKTAWLMDVGKIKVIE
jgi:hypothetical protein